MIPQKASCTNCSTPLIMPWYSPLYIPHDHCLQDFREPSNRETPGESPDPMPSLLTSIDDPHRIPRDHYAVTVTRAIVSWDKMVCVGFPCQRVLVSGTITGMLGDIIRVGYCRWFKLWISDSSELRWKQWGIMGLIPTCGPGINGGRMTPGLGFEIPSSESRFGEEETGWCV